MAVVAHTPCVGRGGVIMYNQGVFSLFDVIDPEGLKMVGWVSPSYLSQWDF